MDFKPTTITEFQCLALELLRDSFPVIQSAGFNAKLSGHIKTPALFLELVEFSYPENTPSDSLILDCIFNLNIIESSLEEKPMVSLEELAISLSRYIKGNRWNIYAEPASIISSSADDLSPHDEAYRVWTLRFSQSIAIKEHNQLMHELTYNAR